MYSPSFVSSWVGLQCAWVCPWSPRNQVEKDCGSSRSETCAVNEVCQVLHLKLTRSTTVADDIEQSLVSISARTQGTKSSNDVKKRKKVQKISKAYWFDRCASKQNTLEDTAGLEIIVQSIDWVNFITHATVLCQNRIRRCQEPPSWPSRFDSRNYAAKVDVFYCI
jgi:uncharacterized protein YcfL